MDGQRGGVDGETDEWIDGQRMDGWMDGQRQEWMDRGMD